MFEIKITNLETGEEKETLQADGMLLVTMNEDEDKPESVVIMETSIEKMSNAMAIDGDVRAACRLAIAKWDGMKDSEQKESRKMLGSFVDMLKNAGL